MKTKKKEVGERKRVVKYRRIGWAAKTLGVSRTHLWYVLEGARQGRTGLADEYARLRQKGDDHKALKAASSGKAVEG